MNWLHIAGFYGCQAARYTFPMVRKLERQCCYCGNTYPLPTDPAAFVGCPECDYEPPYKPWTRARGQVMHWSVLMGLREPESIDSPGLFAPAPEAPGPAPASLHANVIMDPELDDRERMIVGMFLRRYVTWLARKGQLRRMEGYANLYRHIRPGDRENETYARLKGDSAPSGARQS